MIKRSSKEDKPRRSSGSEPHLGIFWLVDGELVIQHSALAESEAYGDHRNYSGSHIEIWKQLQRQQCVPAESEYEEFPRGRVIFHPASDAFTILADHCILARKDLIERIKKVLRLPQNVNLSDDLHYRCAKCLYGADSEEEEENER